jgi:hypothetical protein
MFKSLSSKKGQAGTISLLVFGIATLVVAVIIAFVVVQTLTGADLLKAQRVTTTVTNETSYLNSTTYSVTNIADKNLNFVSTSLYCNTSTDYELIPTANYTLSTAGVLSITLGATSFTDCKGISYTYDTYTNEEYSASLLAGNLSSGVDNVSSKVPTVLLVAAIVLILAVLALLVGAWQSMRAGPGI